MKFRPLLAGRDAARPALAGLRLDPVARGRGRPPVLGLKVRPAATADDARVDVEVHVGPTQADVRAVGGDDARDGGAVAGRMAGAIAGRAQPFTVDRASPGRT